MEIFCEELADTGVIIKVFSDAERVLREKTGDQRGSRHESVKDGVRQRSRGWKDESFNKEAQVKRGKKSKINKRV